MFERMHLNNQIHQSFVQLVFLLISFEPETPYFKLLTEGDHLAKSLVRWINADTWKANSSRKRPVRTESQL